VFVETSFDHSRGKRDRILNELNRIKQDGMKTSFTILAILLFNIYAAQSVAQISVNSDIVENTTWTVSDSPVSVQNTITVSEGVTLTIDPGVTVEMANGASLYVDGALAAAGQNGNLITFTSSQATPAPGDWGSIEFRNNSDAGSLFDYVVVEYGAGTDRTGMVFYTTGAFGVNISNSIFRNSAVHGINLRASSPTLDNSEFYDNNGYGIYTDLSLSFSVQNSIIRDNTVGGIRVPINSSALITNSEIDSNPVGILIDNGGAPTLTNNQIVNNEYGIRIIEVGATKPEITDNTISGNTEYGAENLSSNVLDAKFNFWGSSLGPTTSSNPSGNGDRVTEGNVDYTPWRYGATDLPVVEVSSNVVENTVWETGNVFHLTSDITIGSAATLTIEPGAVVKFAAGRSLTVDGQLMADGTTENLIFFTSDRDDAAGGDSNGDGDISLPSQNDWSQININNSGSQISHTVIRYGGSSNTSSSGVLNLNAPISLSDVIVSNNFRNGIYSDVDQIGWTNVRSIDNSNHGILFYESGLAMTGGEASLSGSVGLYFRSSDVEKTIELDGFVSSDNNSHGIHIDGISSRQGTRISSLLNSDISGNGGTGVLLYYSQTGVQLFDGNLIQNNSGHGINLSHGMTAEEIVFQNNQILGNGQSGILSTQARFIDNHFEGNRFGIGAWKELGHIYTDASDVDGNTFTDNTYPGAIALYADNLNGTLSATVPVAFSNPTYVLASTGTANSSSDVLTIEPGVTIKTSSELVSAFTELRFEGQLIASGDEVNPIVFTSVNDHTYGGDVSRVEDTSSPSRGDWAGVQLHRSGTAESILSHVYFRYARNGITVGDVFSNPSGVVYQNTFEDIWVDQSSQNGFQVREGAITLERLRSTNNSRSGVHLEDANNGNGFVARAIVRNAEITGNGGSNTSYAGLFARSINDGAAFTEVSNSIISGNSVGIQMERPSLPVSILGNNIENSSSHGILINSRLTRTDLAYIGNQILGNGQSGILSTQARFIDNHFEGNRFGIGAWKELGHIYTDASDVDGNTFTDNTYPGAIALYADNLNGTLSATVPVAFSNPTYVLASTGTANSSSDVLTIEPGVTIKTSSELVSAFTELRFEGQLIASGDEVNPIVFTSVNDHTYGGDVSRVEDTSSPSRGDWAGVQLHRSGTAESVLSHVYFRYARNGITVGDVFSNPSGVVYQNTFEDIWVDQSSQNGFQVREGAITLERLRSTNNSRSGVHLEDANNGNGFVARAIVRNAEITGNGGSNTSYAGLFARSINDGAAFTEVSNSTISGNSVGIRMEASSLPSSIQFNTITDNANDGINTRLVSVETDTSLTISGNTVSGHTSGTGALVTRAIISDNTFENNAFPIGLMGELSKEGSANENGTLFEGNIIGEHVYQDAIALYSSSNMSLQGKLGYTWPESFENGVYIPIVGTTYINSSNSVEVAPGTVFKMGHNSTSDSFLIQGEFLVEGGVDDKIVFTSIKDDSFAGDTNKDDNATLPGRRDWHSLEFRNSGSNTSLLKHAIVRYGRYNLYVRNSEMVVDSSFTSNADRGVYTLDGAKPTIRNSEIHSNQYGIYVNSDSDDPNIHLNNIYDNDDAGLYVRRDVTAIDNYWGDLTGPFVDQGSDLNLDGQGDRIEISGSYEVTYRPFLTDRTGVLLGDVSEDGSISAFDGSLILQYVVELMTLEASQIAAADVSGDGSVSAMDASYVLQYVVGLITGFPGAGKLPEFEADEIYEIETIVADSYFDMIIKTKGNMDVYAGEIELNYPEQTVSDVEILKTAETANWNTINNSDRGNLKVAIAGLEAIKEQGDLIHLRFNRLDEEQIQLRDIQISSLKINEVDVSESAGEDLSDQTENLLPESFTLQQNYPNPFNPTTNIQYQIPAEGQVSVRVFNTIGQEVAVLVNNQVQTAGTYQLEWNAINVSSGIYFYKIEVTGADGRQFTDVKRMTLIK
jgi:parallel beta-helix repeat protein